MTGVELEDILSELFPSDDPLDQKDFDVNQYINSLFPNEQSLNGLEDVILEMTNRIDDLDGEVSNLVREGNQNSFESENLLNQSMEEIKEMSDIKETISNQKDTQIHENILTQTNQPVAENQIQRQKQRSANHIMKLKQNRRS